MTDWTAYHQSNESLRLSVARLKAARLGLPPPGSLLRVKLYTPLHVIDGTRGWGHPRGELLLLVGVYPMAYDSQTRYDLVDPVELVLMSVRLGGALVTTGIVAGADAMTSFEAL